MRPLVALTAALSLGCASASGMGGAGAGPTPIWVRSHNRSVVDVYLLCGDRNAQWLGEVPGKSSEGLAVPAGLPYCGRGLNFFLVVRSVGRGYWVGPIPSDHGGQLELVIEKYAGLSSARVLPGGR